MNLGMATTAVLVAEPVDSAESTAESAQQAAEREGLAFAATPGPGYSEGGNVHEPKAASHQALCSEPRSEEARRPTASRLPPSAVPDASLGPYEDARRV
jgi:hypothetical protein